jgi:hypothetical protein
MHGRDGASSCDLDRNETWGFVMHLRLDGLALDLPDGKQTMAT